MTRADWIATLRSWDFSPWVVGWLIMLALVYARGWIRYRHRGADRFPLIRFASFIGGLLAIFVALQSPLDAFASFSLQVHMVQHLLLMIVAPPLLLGGTPTLPLIAGLPKSFRDAWIIPFAQWPVLRTFLSRLLHPVTTWSLFVLTLWLWHSPPMYEFGAQLDRLAPARTRMLSVDVPIVLVAGVTALPDAI